MRLNNGAYFIVFFFLGGFIDKIGICRVNALKYYVS